MNPLPSEIVDRCNAFLRAARLGDEFRADLAKVAQAAYDAGAATTCTHVHSAPLTDAEIAALRDSWRKAGE